MEAYHGARFFGQCTQACYLGLDSGPPRWRRDREFESVFLQRGVHYKLGWLADADRPNRRSAESNTSVSTLAD